MIAIILSIIYPGLGQIYYGKTWRGVIMILFTLIPFAYPVILVWSIVDCVNLRKNHSPDPLTRKEAITAIIVFFVVIPGIMFLLLTAGISTVEYVSHNYTKPRTTKKELVEISNSILRYKQQTKTVPQSLIDLIGSRPLRRTWLTDSWDNHYVYVLDSDSTITIISKGKDNMLNTDDDIKITVANKGS